ncbi:enoyl-CoA hydratase-related protein [Desulfatitalea alkaliphila]|uniref:Enoyl-CoA hydratase-related protein n=1 Tax=Desulfatitalea alkaliphila TaxID=2929485 RepID=A0AA41R5T2_9BACT|nr:enoyl-CoA hydratase-related protein [Desulfatitalea alkaliphila]MCJ8502326.1 enoyl-CoA hydratase-related protein [Desulfatitalea alkaliphila]
MDDTIVTLDMEGPVAVLRLNRPEVMNAFNQAMVQALGDRLDLLRFDPAVRVVIVTGAGKAFSAGADLKERAGMTPEQVRAFLFKIRRLMDDVEQFSKPVIAAVNGVALGGGTELALAADIRIAADSATMGLTETRLAIIPGAGGTQRLPRLVGKGVAKEMIFTGRRIDALAAQRIGLVNQVHPPDELMAACLRLAAEIGECGPVAVEQAKYAINRGLETDMATGLAIESNAYWVCIPTEDRTEGLAAFREKRKPQYKGK